jgi:hypothetical protein
VPACFLSLFLDLFGPSPAGNRLITGDNRQSIHSLHQGFMIRSADLAVGGALRIQGEIRKREIRTTYAQSQLTI